MARFAGLFQERFVYACCLVSVVLLVGLCLFCAEKCWCLCSVFRCVLCPVSSGSRISILFSSWTGPCPGSLAFIHGVFALATRSIRPFSPTLPAIILSRSIRQLSKPCSLRTRLLSRRFFIMKMGMSRNGPRAIPRRARARAIARARARATLRRASARALGS